MFSAPGCYKTTTNTGVQYFFPFNIYFFVHMYICALCDAWCLRRSEKETRSRVGLRGSYEPLCGSWELNPGVCNCWDLSRPNVDFCFKSFFLLYVLIVCASMCPDVRTEVRG